MSENVLSFALEKEKEGKVVALVTVLETTGSSPASEGQMMAVLADGTSVGTIGGGKSEFEIKNQAVEAIKSGRRVFKFDIDHSKLGMVCGGTMMGFAAILGNNEKLLIFGGGHISQALAKIALVAGFSVSVVEDRAELAQDFPKEVQYIVSEPDEYKDKLFIDKNTYVVICTRGHKLDFDSLSYVLHCKDLDVPYIGMIGSRTKVGTLMEMLEKDGVSQKKRESIYAPVGLDIACEKPAEIAIAIMAEIIKIKNNGSLNHMRDKNSR